MTAIEGRSLYEAVRRDEGQMRIGVLRSIQILGVRHWLKRELCGWLFAHRTYRVRRFRAEFPSILDVRTDLYWRECYCGARGGVVGNL